MPTKTRMFSRTAIAALAIFSIAACAKDGDDTGDTSADTAQTALPTPPPSPVMTDANILAAMTAGDSMEIEMGTAMKTMATDAGLKQFGTMLVTDHSAHVQQVADVATKAAITPALAADDTTAQHTANMKTHMSSMTKGAATDSMFIAEAINGHQAKLDKLNAADAAAQNADVKALIAATRPVVQKHLDDAKALQDKMTKK